MDLQRAMKPLPHWSPYPPVKREQERENIHKREIAWNRSEANASLWTTGNTGAWFFFFSDNSQESRLKLLLPALFHLAAKTPSGTAAALFFWTWAGEVSFSLLPMLLVRVIWRQERDGLVTALAPGALKWVILTLLSVTSLLRAKCFANTVSVDSEPQQRGKQTGSNGKLFHTWGNQRTRGSPAEALGRLNLTTSKKKWSKK